MEQEEKASEDTKTREESRCPVQSLFPALRIMPSRWQTLQGHMYLLLLSSRYHRIIRTGTLLIEQSPRMGADQSMRGGVLCCSFKGTSRGTNWVAVSGAWERKNWAGREDWGFTSRDMVQVPSKMNSPGRVSCTSRGWERGTENHRDVNSRKRRQISPKFENLYRGVCVTHWGRGGYRKKTRCCKL